MRRFAALSLALLWSGCGEEETPAPYQPPALPQPCAVSDAGYTRCAVNVLQTCVNEVWDTTVNCAATQQVCTETSATAAVCETPVIMTCAANESGNRRCTGERLESCDGADWTLVEICAVPEFCAALTATTADCQVQGCTPAELGSTKCEDDYLLECNGSQWDLQENCASTNKICEPVAGLTGVSRCVTPVPLGAEGEACTTNAGCDAAAGLVCSSGPTIFSVTSGLESEICVDECTGDADCDGAEYCEDGGVADQDFCWADSAANAPCLTDKGCASVANLSCSPIVGLASECLDLCDAAGLYTTAGCTGGNSCLPHSEWESELTGTPPAPKPCPNGDGDCAATYGCVTFSEGNLCVRHPGICGTATPIAVDLTTTGLDSLVTNFATSGTQTLCEVPGNNWFCGAPASGYAEVECAELNSGFYFTDENNQRLTCDYNPTSSIFNLDCALVGGECVNFNPASCGFIAKVCVAFCEDEDGVSIAGACVDPAVCGVAAAAVGYPIIQGGTTPVSCTTPGQPTGCESASGFACRAFADGNYCARYRKVCGTAGVTP